MRGDEAVAGEPLVADVEEEKAADGVSKKSADKKSPQWQFYDPAGNGDGDGGHDGNAAHQGEKGRILPGAREARAEAFHILVRDAKVAAEARQDDILALIGEDVPDVASGGLADRGEESKYHKARERVPLEERRGARGRHDDGG